jgi:hypothetical protein
MTSKKIIFALLMTIIAFNVHGKMYKCIDSHGKVSYSGFRCQSGQNQETAMKVKNNTAAKVANEADEVGIMPGLPIGPFNPDMKKSPTGLIGYGINSNHPQLKGLVVSEKDFTGEGLQPSGNRSTVESLYSLKFALDLNKNKSENSKKAPTTPLFVSTKVMGKKLTSNQEMADRMTRAVEWLSQMQADTVIISMPLPRSGIDYKPLCRAFEKQDILFVAEVTDISRGAMGDPTMCKPNYMMVVAPAQ